MTRKETLTIAEDWFKSKKWEPFTFQRQTWNAFLQGKSGLLNAPTGSGKTYALMIPTVLDYIKRNPAYLEKPSSGLKCLWITPLRSLSSEIKIAADRFTHDVAPHWKTEIRTGDTSQADKAKQKKAMPDLLITTPETFHLLLATKGYEQNI